MLKAMSLIDGEQILGGQLKAEVGVGAGCTAGLSVVTGLPDVVCGVTVSAGVKYETESKPYQEKYYDSTRYANWENQNAAALDERNNRQFNNPALYDTGRRYLER